MSAYTARVQRDGEKKARQHMARIGRKGGLTKRAPFVQRLDDDPRLRRIYAKFARQIGADPKPAPRGGDAGQ